jgi:NADPH:quinone reductase-like Zn-dependent oxidoreductase
MTMLMKAAVYERYGPPDVVEIREMPKPVPGDDQVLIRVRATTVTTGDWRARSLAMPPGFGAMGRAFFGFTGPRQQILGTELAGDVEAAGRSVTRFRVGDRVFAFADTAMGCHVEFKCFPQNGPLERIPRNMSYESAAAMSFGGMTALGALRRAKLQRGETVLIVGASGAVGSAAIQVARHLGAEVTAVCSTANLELVRSLGAQHIIDYTAHDFTMNGARYDVIVDTSGTAPFSRVERSLAENGRFIPILGSLGDLLRAPLVALTSRRSVVAGPSKVRRGDLAYLAKLGEAGELTPPIDSRFEFARIVDAHRRVDTGRKKGNVVVTMP